MTPEEFVCWMDGFRQGINGIYPISADWKRITDALDSACRHLHASRNKAITVPSDEARS